MHFEPLIPPKNVKNKYLKNVKDLACITAIPADSQVKAASMELTVNILSVNFIYV